VFEGSTLPSVGPLLLVIEAVGEIERNQAEVGGRGAPTVKDHNMLVTRRAGFQLQISGMELAVRKSVIKVGMAGVVRVVSVRPAYLPRTRSRRRIRLAPCGKN
jgi:hypothetical protein